MDPSLVEGFDCIDHLRRTHEFNSSKAYLCLSDWPQVLLFDEPTYAPAPELVREVSRVLSGLAEEERTMPLITHELGFAYHFANRVFFVSDGVIHDQGTIEEGFKQSKHVQT